MNDYREQLSKIEEEIKTNCVLDDIRIRLTNMLNELVPIKEDANVSFSFDIFLEYYLFNYLYNGDGRFTLIEEPVYKIYYLLAQTYLKEENATDAKKCLKSAIEWNPFDMVSYFSLMDVYNYELDYDKVKIVIFEMHKYIYSFEELGLFYSSLGNYLFNIKKYDIANLVYSYATYFLDDPKLETKLLEIAGATNKPVIVYPKNECIKHMQKLNIPTNVDKVIIEKMRELYNFYKRNKTNYETYIMLKRNLSKLTGDESFEDTKTIKNKYFNFNFEIPESWKVVDVNDYNKNSTGKFTLCVLKIDNSNVINFDILAGESKNLVVDYQQYRKFMINKGFTVKLENEINANGLKYIQSVTQKKLLNEYITIINCIFILKGNLFNISVPTYNNYDEINIKKVFEDKNAIRLNKLINSIQLL